MTNQNSRLPWKGSFKKTPPAITRALANIAQPLVVIRTRKRVQISDAPLYKHLGLTVENAHLLAPGSVQPDADVGRFSRDNREGWSITRRDLPKIIKTDTWETPNFGDGATYGWHTHSTTRLVYPKEHFEPPNLSLVMSVLKQSIEQNEAVLSVALDAALDRRWATFDARLLFHINFLQENVGSVGVYASDTTNEQVASEITLGWEVFPPGTSEAIINAFGRAGSVSREMRGLIEARLKLFESLRPKHILRGSGSFDSYIGAMFSDDLVVFENLNYGNALYVLYEDWRDVSRRSRIDLLRGTTQSFDRFVHRSGWEEHFQEHIKMQLKKRRGR